MKVYYSYTGQHPKEQQHFVLSVALKNKINLLIIIHLAAFLLYHIFGWIGKLDYPLGEGTVDDFIRYVLALSSRTQDMVTQWSTSIFTYQFIHFSWSELLISVSMLWFFGQILQNRIGQLRVIILYFVFVTLAALIFNLSHIIFPIYSGPGEVMDGAFGGVLGLMTTTVFVYGKNRVNIGKQLQLQLWHIYAAAVLLGFILIYRNNMAHILVYTSSIYLGSRYGGILRKQKGLEEGAGLS